MPERPILFSAPLVRAILAGKKTETRRLVTAATSSCGSAKWDNLDDLDRALPANNATGVPLYVPDRRDPDDDATHRVWPRIEAGDTLWVKETWALHWMFDDLSISKARAEDPDCIFYLADGNDAGAHTVPQRVEGTKRAHLGGGCVASQRGRTRVSIHMPRWASRITLLVTEVKAERLHEITNEGAVAEGLRFVRCPDCGVVRAGWSWNLSQTRCEAICGNPECMRDDVTSALDVHREKFAELWDEINGKRPGAAWSDNPWVWVIKFEVLGTSGAAANRSQGVGDG